MRKMTTKSRQHRFQGAMRGKRNRPAGRKIGVACSPMWTDLVHNHQNASETVGVLGKW
jgi:hypothetical protein